MPPKLHPQPTADGPISDVIDRFSARRRGDKVDQRIAGLAEQQHGVVSLGQLFSLGLSEAAVQQRATAGRLHRVQQGVYAVGHSKLSREGEFMAAVLASGRGAVLSHRSAAVLWELTPDSPGPIDVTAPNRRGRNPVSIRAHRDESLLAADRTRVRGIPCTNVARVLLDLAAVLSVGQLRRALSEAEVLRLLDPVALRELIRRSRGRRGVARLRMLMDELHPATRRTRSELERSFLRLCESVGLPEPEVNVRIRAGSTELEADFLWRDAHLIVETDGRRFHGTSSAFELDRRREQLLYAAGWHVVRCTWRQVDAGSAELIHALRNGLARPGPPPTGRFPMS